MPNFSKKQAGYPGAAAGLGQEGSSPKNKGACIINLSEIDQSHVLIRKICAINITGVREKDLRDRVFLTTYNPVAKLYREHFSRRPEYTWECGYPRVETVNDAWCRVSIRQSTASLPAVQNLFRETLRALSTAF